MTNPSRTDHPLHESHPRDFETNRYVYPVLSRRAEGISVGVNLNRDKLCNFDCVYCQVDRRGPVGTEQADPRRLAVELNEMLELAVSGRIFDHTRFSDVPDPLRRLNDIALSGDGEPTASPMFEQAVEICAAARRRLGLDGINRSLNKSVMESSGATAGLPSSDGREKQKDTAGQASSGTQHSRLGLDGVKIVLITNASLLDRPAVQRALDVLDANGGEIWAKLDAGTESHYHAANRSAVPWRRILDNLLESARRRPIVIQSLWMRMRGCPPAEAEIEAFCDRLVEITSSGGRIMLVQAHTVARRPAEEWIASLSTAELEGIAETIRRRTGLTVKTFA